MAVVYFVFVLPMNKAREMAASTPKADETPDDVCLLTEIRDLLAQGSAGSSGPHRRRDPERIRPADLRRAGPALALHDPPAPVGSPWGCQPGPRCIR